MKLLRKYRFLLILTVIQRISLASSAIPNEFKDKPSQSQYDSAWNYVASTTGVVEEIHDLIYDLSEELTPDEKHYIYNVIKEGLRLRVAQKLTLEEIIINAAEKITEKKPAFCQINNKHQLLDKAIYLIRGAASAASVSEKRSLGKATTIGNLISTRNSFPVTGDGIQKAYDAGALPGKFDAYYDDYYVHLVYFHLYIKLETFIYKLNFALNEYCKSQGILEGFQSIDIVVLTIPNAEVEDNKSVQLPIRSFKNPFASVGAIYNKATDSFTIKADDLRKLNIISPQ